MNIVSITALMCVASIAIAIFIGWIYSEVRHQCYDWAQNTYHKMVEENVDTNHMTLDNLRDNCIVKNWLQLPEVKLPTVIHIQEPET